MWLKPGGYARAEGEKVGSGPDVTVKLGFGQKFQCYSTIAQFDTFTCEHCNHVVHVPAKCRPEDMGGLCKICMGLICPKCYHLSRCTPYEEKLKRWAARTEALRSYGL